MTIAWFGVEGGSIFFPGYMSSFKDMWRIEHEDSAIAVVMAEM
jgi:hypothetical protein